MSSSNHSTGLHGNILRVIQREASQYRERRLTETEEIEKSRETKVFARSSRVTRARACERTSFSLVAPSVHRACARARTRALATRNRRTRSSSRFLPFCTSSVHLFSTYCPLFLALLPSWALYLSSRRPPPPRTFRSPACSVQSKELPWVVGRNSP